jgi:hypothetical protein
MTVQLFLYQSQHGTDSAIKEFARSLLPRLRNHLDTATTLYRRVWNNKKRNNTKKAVARKVNATLLVDADGRTQQALNFFQHQGVSMIALADDERKEFGKLNSSMTELAC